MRAKNSIIVSQKEMAEPGEPGKPGASGYSYRPRGLFASGQTYVWDSEYRDICLKDFNGTVYTFRVRVKGSSVTAAPSLSAGDANWEAANELKFVATELLMANNAIINMLQSNDLFIKKADGTVTAGLSGRESGGKVRFWAGSDNPDNAPFRVDESGKLFSSHAEISGNITADSGKIGGFTIDRGSLWWKGRDYFGNDSRSVRIGVPSDEKSGMVDISFNAATSGRFGVRITGSNLGGACVYASRHSEEKDRTYPSYGNTYAGYFDGALFVNDTMSSRLCLADNFGAITERRADGTIIYNQGIDHNFGTLLFRKGLLVRSS